MTVFKPDANFIFCRLPDNVQRISNICNLTANHESGGEATSDDEDR